MTITLDRSASETMRNAMITSQLRTNAVSDQRVIAAMATVAREDYVPTGARAIAYRDTTLPVGGGRAINLPMATGRLLTEADLETADRVLLIGAAGGYTAALLARIVAHVVAVEQDADLLAIARPALAREGKIELVEGPLADGYAAGAPYDVLIVDGAIPEVPERLAAQVRVGGRVVTGLVDRGVTRLASGRRTEGGFGVVPFVDCDCALLPGFSKPVAFRF